MTKHPRRRFEIVAGALCAADVVIVGSGVAGSLVATRLAKGGVKVLILEAGPRVQRAEALAQYHGALIKVPESPYPDAPFAPHPRSDRPDGYYLQDGPDTFGSTTCARGAVPPGTGWARRSGSSQMTSGWHRSRPRSP